MLKNFATCLIERHAPSVRAREFLKYIGPGLLVTVGFIDPGNWASNIAAGSQFGYALLWVITLSTVMLILLQHNAAHLGIVTGDCLAEAATRHLRPWVSRLVLLSAVGAAVSTALAEILGAAIALNMLFRIPLVPGALLTVAVVSTVLFTNTYRKVEKWIIGFVSLIGLSFLFELALVEVPWRTALVGLVKPQIPHGSLPILMSVLGEAYNIKDRHSRVGMGLTFGLAAVVLLFIGNPFQGLVWSQVALSVQLPVTVFLLLALTSSRKVMGTHANTPFSKVLLFAIAGVITLLNILLFVDIARQLA